MNSYQTSSPRTVISIAAVAMTALTLGLSILPAGKSSDQAVAKEVSRGDIPAVDVAAGDGAPIVVYGFRGHDSGLLKASAPHVTPPRKHQS